MKNLLFIPLLFLFGCASYNQKAVCLQLGTSNASVPYIGGATSGSGYACYISCVGEKCPVPGEQTILDLTKSEIQNSQNNIVTAGPVRISVQPVK